mgnify:FL=1
MDNTIKFDKNDTQILKGIAIILMVCNHLFPIPEWIFPENQFIDIIIGSKGLAAYFGGFSKICVAIFAMLSGIGFYHTYNRFGNKKGYIHNLKKLLPFFMTYWVCILMFYLPIICIGGSYELSYGSLLCNLTGYETTIIKIAWYVRFYFEIVLLSPIWINLYDCLQNKIESHLHGSPCISVLIAYSVITIGTILITLLSEHMSSVVAVYIKEFSMYLPVVLLGYAIEKGKIIEIMIGFLNGHRKAITLCAISYPIVFIGCFLGRGLLNRIVWFNCDIIIAPIFIFATSIVLQKMANKYINNVLIFLGYISLEIWFLHAIFFIGNSRVQKIAYWGRYPIIILIWTIIILIPVALTVKKIVKCICKN